MTNTSNNSATFIVVDNLDGRNVSVSTEHQATRFVEILNDFYADEVKSFEKENDSARFAWEKHSIKCPSQCYHFSLVKKNDQSK